MSPATAETLPTLASDGLLIRSAAAIVRNDLGILALLIAIRVLRVNVICRNCGAELFEYV